MSISGIIYDIKRFSVNDGPGIRTTVFFKGCPLACRWCHNPESRSGEIEQATLIRKLGNKEFCQQETIGKSTSIDEVMDEIGKDSVFYETSTGGVTFSGGEPLFQPEFLKALAEACRSEGIHTCLDTSGYCSPQLFRDLIPKIDLFLYDIKILNREEHIHFVGYPNDDILHNLRQLDDAGGNYIIRVPVIPGVNLDKASMSGLLSFLESFSNPMKEIHFLPYHTLARHKFRNLGLMDEMEGTLAVDQQVLVNLATEFEQNGYKVKIGG